MKVTLKYRNRNNNIGGQVIICWSTLEKEMREAIASTLSDRDKIIKIDSILGWHTQRGYELDQTIIRS